MNCPKCNAVMSFRNNGLTVNPANQDKKKPTSGSVSVCTNKKCGHTSHSNQEVINMPTCPECSQSRMIAAANDMIVDVEATKKKLITEDKEENKTWQYKPSGTIHYRCIKCDHFWKVDQQPQFKAPVWSLLYFYCFNNNILVF